RPRNQLELKAVNIGIVYGDDAASEILQIDEIELLIFEVYMEGRCVYGEAPVRELRLETDLVVVRLLLRIKPADGRVLECIPVGIEATAAEPPAIRNIAHRVVGPAVRQRYLRLQLSKGFRDIGI